MKQELATGKSIIPGIAEGIAVVLQEPFSFTGEFDRTTGTIVNPRSSLFGESLKDKVFVYPYGRGSSCTSAVLAEAIRCGNAPCAIINVQVEPILVIGVLVAEVLYDSTIPILGVSQETFQLLHTGDNLIVDAIAEKLYRKEST